MSKITALEQKINKAQAELERMQAEYAALRLEKLREVQLTKIGATTTMVFENRKVKATQNRHYRLTVTEGGQILASNYMGSIADLRFALATGAI